MPDPVAPGSDSAALIVALCDRVLGAAAGARRVRQRPDPVAPGSDSAALIVALRDRVLGAAAVARR